MENEYLAGSVPLTEKQINGLLWMWRVLWEETTHPKVTRRLTGGSLAFTVATIEELGDVVLMKQNPHKSTIFANAANNGIRIAWLFNHPDGGYVGPVIAQLTGELKPKIYPDGNSLRAILNPVSQM